MALSLSLVPCSQELRLCQQIQRKHPLSGPFRATRFPLQEGSGTVAEGDQAEYRQNLARTSQCYVGLDYLEARG